MTNSSLAASQIEVIIQTLATAHNGWLVDNTTVTTCWFRPYIFILVSCGVLRIKVYPPYDANFPRNQIILLWSVRQMNVDIFDCHCVGVNVFIFPYIMLLHLFYQCAYHNNYATPRFKMTLQWVFLLCHAIMWLSSHGFEEVHLKTLLSALHIRIKSVTESA